MKCALAAVGFINEDIENNKNTIIETMINWSGKASVVIFGEAFLQGFYGANFVEEHDAGIAVSKNSQVIGEIRSAAKEYAVAVSFGFIEKDQDYFYSSQITIDKNGEVLDLYRRVSPGWKECFAGEKYREGSNFHTFLFKGKKVGIALCGDLWDDDNICKINALNPDVIWWPVYTDYNFNEWNNSVKNEYAEQVSKLSAPILYVNSLCIDKADEEEIAKGGAVLFDGGTIKEEIASGKGGILIVEC